MAGRRGPGRRSVYRPPLQELCVDRREEQVEGQRHWYPAHQPLPILPVVEVQPDEDVWAVCRVYDCPFYDLELEEVLHVLSVLWCVLPQDGFNSGQQVSRR